MKHLCPGQRSWHWWRQLRSVSQLVGGCFALQLLLSWSAASQGSSVVGQCAPAAGCVMKVFLSPFCEPMAICVTSIQNAISKSSKKN